MKKNAVLFLSLVLLLSALSACGGADGRARAPFGSGDYQGEPLEDIVSQLESAGFTNVDTKSMLTYSESEDGTVGTVTIDGSSLFRSGNAYSVDAAVVVSYYAMMEPDELEATATAEPDNSDSVEDTKAAALAIDQQFIGICSLMEASYYKFLSDVKSNSFDTELEAYEAADSLKTELLGYYSQLLDVESEADLEYFDDFRLALYTYASGMITVAEKSMEYFDDGLTSTLSEFQDAVALVPEYYDACYMLQDNFLNAAGFTFDEIDEMLGNLEED